MAIQSLSAIQGGAPAEALRELAGAAAAAPAADAPAPSAAGGAPFADVLGRAIDTIATQQKEADRRVLEVASGQSDDLAGMMMSVHRAGLAFDLGLEVRNRLMDAYHEVMRMTV